MSVKSYNLELIRGDNKSYALHFTDAVGADINITNYTIYFTVTDDLEATDDSHAKIVKTITSHTNAVQGKSIINLLPADTNLLGDYYYDIQVKRPSGSVETILSGVITFNADATKRS